MVKMAMFAPIPRAKVSSATAVVQSRALQQGAQGVARILQAIRRPTDGLLVAMQFFGLLDAAVCAARLESRISGFHGLSFEFVLKNWFFLRVRMRIQRHDTLGNRRDMTADLGCRPRPAPLNLDMQQAPAAHFCPLFAHEARARLTRTSLCRIM